MPQKWDLPKLLDDIQSSLAGVKEAKFIAEIATWSQKQLESKKVVAENIIRNYSLLASLNVLNLLRSRYSLAYGNIICYVHSYSKSLWFE